MIKKVLVSSLLFLLTLSNSCYNQRQNEDIKESESIAINQLNSNSTNKIVIGNQTAIVHNENNSYGYWHKFNEFKTSQKRKVYVFLPHNYKKSNKKYPILYANDAQTAFWKNNFSGKTWDMAGTVERLKKEKLIEDIIIVAIEPINRDKEYTYTDFADKRKCCEAKNYLNDVLTYIKPFIEKNYPVKNNVSDTAIIGSSHGGLSAFYIGSRSPNNFGKVATLSASFWAGIDYNYKDNNQKKLIETTLITEVEKNLKNKKQRPIFWIDWGMKRNGGNHNKTTERLSTKRSKEMVNLLQKNFNYKLNQDLFTFEDKIGGHDEDAWRYRFGLVIKKFFPAKKN